MRIGSKLSRILVVMMIFVCNGVVAQTVLPLYKDSIPGSKGDINPKDAPSITAYFPEKGKSNGTSMIIFPGGAYAFLAWETEGVAIAKAFVEKGITAFIVKYRLPDDKTMRDKAYCPLMDAQQAIKLVRMRGWEWKLNPHKVGVIGYSAGGHLASTLLTHYDTSYIPNIENTDLKPDFGILVYPVITFDGPYALTGLVDHLVGKGAESKRRDYFSTEKQVNHNTPPTYLTHAGDDGLVNVNNSILFYQALQASKVPAELHLYAKGDHGFTQRLPVDEWRAPMLDFMKRYGFFE